MITCLSIDTFSQYGPAGVLLLTVLLTAAVIMTLTHLIGPSRSGKTKGIVYESGMNPITTVRRRFNVRFYIVAMTFLVFDVEIIFLYPWAMTFASLDPDAGLSGMFLARMLFFVLTTVVAFAYALRKGVFRYD